jgi:hypothetical protein
LEEIARAGLDNRRQMEHICDCDEVVQTTRSELQLVLEPEVEQLCREWGAIAKAIIMRRSEHSR